MGNKINHVDVSKKIDPFGMAPSFIYEPFPYIVLVCSIIFGFAFWQKTLPLILDILMGIYGVTVILMRKNYRKTSFFRTK